MCQVATELIQLSGHARNSFLLQALLKINEFLGCATLSVEYVLNSCVLVSESPEARDERPQTKFPERCCWTSPAQRRYQQWPE
jgi:hypothetical protein